MTESIAWNLAFSSVKTSMRFLDERKRKIIIEKLSLLLRDNRNILLFGISGAGKTQFINSLNRSLDIPNRTLTTDTERYNLSAFPIKFIDTPGHVTRHFNRREEVIKAMKRRVEGIINVVSYGYDESSGNHLEDVFNEKGEVKQAFLTKNRKEEIDRLSEWIDLIGAKEIGWIINLVTKADLWWDKPDDVSHYYENTYFESFKTLDRQMPVLTLPYCSIIKPFYGLRTSGKFGDIHKHQMQESFLHQLENLIKREA